MGRPSKRQKPAFARNVVAKRKERGWNGQDLAEAAKIPYPTLRDIEAGINAGREETKSAIAKALGASLSELYSEGAQSPQHSRESVRRAMQSLAKKPSKASLEEIRILLDQLAGVGEIQRALALALLAGDYEVARPLVSEDYPSLVSLLKAL